MAKTPGRAYFDPSQHTIHGIPDDTTAKAFVEEHHYSHTYPAARFRFGLLDSAGNLVGVAVFGVPANQRVLTSTFPGLDPSKVVDFGRLVVLEHVGHNAESWMIGQAFKKLKEFGIEGVVSYADPVVRVDAEGREVRAGHVGTIYQATNAVYLGRGTPRTLRLLPDGNVFSDRTASKIRKKQKGWRPAVDLLVSYGARPPRKGENLAEWWKAVRDTVTRTIRHKGNHKYAWGLTKRAKKKLPPSKPYPKLDVVGMNPPPFVF